MNNDIKKKNVIQQYIQENYLLYAGIIFIILFQTFWIVQFKFFIQSDDFGYIANAAFFAGYNWNNYTGDMTPYYNIGFSYFPAVFFRITSNPIIIYRLLLVYILGLQILLHILVYKIFIKFEGQNKVAASIGAFVYSVSIFSPQSGLYFMAEVPYALSLLIILYFLLSSISASKKKRIIYSAICGFVLAYSYSVHTRFLISFVVVFFVIFLYRLIYKKNILNMFVFILSFLFTFILTYYWVKSVQEVLYKPTDITRDIVEITGNDALTRITYISEYIKKFMKIESWWQFGEIFFSLIGMYALLTGGTVWLVIISDTNMLRKTIKQQICDKNVFVLTLFGLVSFLGMNCLVAANGVMDINGAKWLTYIRYSRPYIGILFIAFFPELWKKHINKRELLSMSILSLVSFLAIVQYVGPIYQNTTYSSVSPVGWMKYFFFYVYQDTTPMKFFSTITLISLLVSIIIYLSLYFNKRKLALLILVGYSLLHTISENQWNLEKESGRNYNMVDGTMAFMEKYGEEITVPLYFMQGTYAGKLRFGLFSYDMRYILDVKDLNEIDYSNAVLFSDSLRLYDADEQKRPKTCFEVDQQEYVYTSNKEIIEMLRTEYKTIDF